MRYTSARIVASVAALVGLVGGGAAPAFAETGAARDTGHTSSEILACNAVDVGLTVRDGNYVKGSGSWNKCDDSVNRVRITLWEDSGPDFIRDRLEFNPAPFGAHSRTVQALCKGHGTDNWFTIVEAWNASGVLVTYKQSNVLRTTC